MDDLKATLEDGRDIFLDSLYLYFSNAGNLEGQVRASENNLRVFEDCKDVAAKNWPNENMLIADQNRHIGSDAISVPEIAFVGLFVSYRPTRNREKTGSSLVICWFQNSLDITENNVGARIRDVCWNDAARDFDW